MVDDHSSSSSAAVAHTNNQKRKGKSDVINDNNKNDDRNLLLVTEISDTACSLTTSLKTQYNGWETSNAGIMFTVQPTTESLELLTIEFQANEYASSVSGAIGSEKVQVYYRMGNFSDVINASSEWILLSDTAAHIIKADDDDSNNSNTDNIGAVVPINEFDSVTFNAGQVYSIYISLSLPPSSSSSSSSTSSSFMKTKPSDRRIGEISAENELLKVQTGVSLDGMEPFPTSFVETTDFTGILHYQVIQSCDDVYSVTESSPLVLNFAVDGEPTDEVTAALSDAVVETVNELLVSNKNLAMYTQNYGLQIEGIKSQYQGSIDEKCPENFQLCSLISSTVWLNYMQSLPSFSVISMDIYSEEEQINDSVSSYMAPVAETQYIGTSLSKMEFVITLMGTPNGSIMNDIQKKYFEDVTLNFLQDYSSITSSMITIFTVTAIENTPETIVEQDEVRQLFSPSCTSSWCYDADTFVMKRKLTEAPIKGTSISAAATTRTRKYLRQRRRNLQVKDDEIITTTYGGTQIITEIAAETTMQELRSIVLDGIGNNQAMYVNDLVTQQMRPGEINQQNFGMFFADLTGASVKLGSSSSPGSADPSNNGNGPPPSDDGTTAAGGSIWVIVCILLIVFSLLWILYRAYIDCFYSPSEVPLRQNNDCEDEKSEEIKEEHGATHHRSFLPKFGRKKASTRGLERSSDTTDSISPQKDGNEQEAFNDETEPFVNQAKNDTNNTLQAQYDYSKPNPTSKSDQSKRRKTTGLRIFQNKPNDKKQRMSTSREAKKPNSFHNDGGSDSSSDSVANEESCTTDESEEEGSDKRRNSNSYGSDSNSDSSHSSSVREKESPSITKQKKKPILMHQDTKRNNRSVPERGKPNKTDKLVPLERKSAEQNWHNLNTNVATVVTNSVHTKRSYNSNKKQTKCPPKERGIAASKSMPSQLKMRKKDSTESNSLHNGKYYDKNRLNLDKNMTVETNSAHNKSTVNRNKKQQKRPPKERGIAASKSMPSQSKMRRKYNIESNSLHNGKYHDDKNRRNLGKNMTVKTNSTHSKSTVNTNKLKQKRPPKNRSIVASKSMPIQSNRQSKIKNTNTASKKKIPKEKAIKRTNSDTISKSKNQETIKRREIRPSKSMPVGKKKPKTKSSVILWTDMVHDSETDSDEDSVFVLETVPSDEDSDVSSLSASGHKRKVGKSSRKKSDTFNLFKYEEENRKRFTSQVKNTTMKQTRNLHGKAGKIKFDTTIERGLNHVTPSKLEEMLSERA